MHYLWSDEQTIKKLYAEEKAKGEHNLEMWRVSRERESFMAFRKIKKGGSKM